MPKRKIIAICSSADFYRHAATLQTELEKNGYKAILPGNAELMKQSGDFDAAHYRTWLNDAADYPKKTALIRQHFNEVEKAAAILIVNDNKHGEDNYIGGNVLIEMALAFYLGKTIFIFNGLPEDSAYLEEITAMNPIALHGSLATLYQALSEG